MKGQDLEATWGTDPNSTWSDGETPDDPQGDLSLPGAERYITVRVLGVGSIGEVFLAQDRRLGRQVAYKVLRQEPPPSPAAEERFLRESLINAQLNHPGIVPVFDAGVQEDGTRFYTMRMVKGRSLAEAMAACKTLSERLGLMGHYLALVQAMAYAHARGVVHRDLKPANVMVGEYGETQIIDWGLAKQRGAPELGGDTSGHAPTLVGVKHNPAHTTQMGTVMGTPRYMSPEQARGEVQSVDQRSDVFSLGAMLYELLTGKGPFDGGGTLDVLARVREGRAAPVAQLEPEVPTELAAIAEKALAPWPDARYQNARALAEDLERWRDGALVGAYAYRPRDHLRRFLRQNRGMLSVVAVALVLLMLLGVLFADRVLAERNRALAAEQSATQRLGSSFVLQADAAREAGRWSVAELYAANALALAEDPVARGVVAGSRARPALRLLGMEPTDTPCEDLILGQEVVGCSGADSFTLRFRGERAHTLLTLPGYPIHTAIRGDRVAWIGDSELRLYSAKGSLIGSFRGANALAVTPIGDREVVASFSRTLRRINLTDNSVRWKQEFPDVLPMVLPSEDGSRLLVATRGSSALELDASTGERLHSFGPVPSMAGVVAYSEDEAEVIVGAGTGEVVIFNRKTGEERLRTGRFGAAVTAMFTLPGLLVVRVEDGSVRVYSLEDGREVAALQESERARFGVAVDRERGEVVTSGLRGLRRWGVDELGRRAEWTLPEGLLDASISPQGHRLATLTGLRQGALFSLPDGALIAEWTPSIKPGGRRVVFSSDGAALLFGDVNGPIELRSVVDGQIVQRLDGPANLLAAAAHIIVGVSSEVMVFDLKTQSRVALFPSASIPRDLELSADGRTLVWSERSDPVITVVSGLGEPVQRRHDVRTSEPVQGLSVSPDGQRLCWSLQTGEIIVADLNGQEQLRLIGHQHLVQRTAWSPDGRRLASAGWDGTARIWDLATGREIAQLRGHQHRVWSVSFTADGRTLATSSWDHTARLWDLSVLDTPGEALVRVVRERYGLVLDGARAAWAEPE